VNLNLKFLSVESNLYVLELLPVADGVKSLLKLFWLLSSYSFSNYFCRIRYYVVELIFFICALFFSFHWIGVFIERL
jgi:hypothetical protein